jgi:hypothetical protein
MKEILAKLQVDEHYYGAFGKQWLSNSDIITLLNEPHMFRKPKDMTKAMLIGRYFHTAILEPEKLSSAEFLSIDSSSRNTKIYKEALDEHGVPLMMLTKEKEATDCAISKLTSNLDFYEAIYQEGNQFEIPAVTEIMGLKWKGKADIVTPDILIDLKTTSNIREFKYSARKYNYDSQAYIYQQLFDKPLVFYVVDKISLQLGIFYPSDNFLANGRDKIERAMEVYGTYFAPGSTQNINDYVHKETL